MQEELKPCPFCGGKPELAPSGYVFCQKCLARTYELGNGAATWNKREHECEASINALTIKNEWMRKQVEELSKPGTDETAEMQGLRQRIHFLERHNQWFERCESAWCHPSKDNNPAIGFTAGLGYLEEDARARAGKEPVDGQ